MPVTNNLHKPLIYNNLFSLSRAATDPRRQTVKKIDSRVDIAAPAIAQLRSPGPGVRRRHFDPPGACTRE